MTSDEFLILILSSTAIGAAAFVFARTVANALRTEDLEQDDAWRYDVTRINELRRVSPLYRMFQPVIQMLAKLNRRAFREQLPEIDREVQAAGLPRVWSGADYLARLELIALLMSPLYFYVCLSMMGLSGTILATVMTIVTAYLLRRRLGYRAKYRLVLIKRRLPFLLDLLTLLMEAGSTFLQALQEGVNEFRDHPVGAEFGRVMAELNMGKTRMKAFESMRRRLDDDEVTSIVGSIIQGEQLGTPLARLFRTQADVLRIKRTQRAETLAGEAGVKMLLPAILVMGATVIVILGPFIISFFAADFLP